MNAETMTKPEAIAAPAKREPAKPVNPAAVKKAILTSISGLQRPLTGVDSRGSGRAAHDHTSITREIITDGK